MNNKSFYSAVVEAYSGLIILAEFERKAVSCELVEKMSRPLPDNIYEHLLKLLDTEYAGIKSAYQLFDLSSEIWQLNKSGYDMDKMFEQFYLQKPVPQYPGYIEEEYCGRTLHFFSECLYLNRAWEEYHENMEADEICPFDRYFPNKSVKNDRCSRYLHEAEMASRSKKYNATVVKLAEERACLEKTITFNGKTYIVTIPKTSAEIVNEAAAMQNCIATRLGEYAKREWVYAFIRDAENPDTPLVDAVIRNDVSFVAPVWVITKGHINVKGDNEEVFKMWWSEAKEKLEKLNNVGVA